jgi:hypothetical protein
MRSRPTSESSLSLSSSALFFSYRPLGFLLKLKYISPGSLSLCTTMKPTEALWPAKLYHQPHVALLVLSLGSVAISFYLPPCLALTFRFWVQEPIRYWFRNKFRFSHQRFYIAYNFYWSINFLVWSFDSTTSIMLNIDSISLWLHVIYDNSIPL